MPDLFKIIFISAGSGTEQDLKAVAKKLSLATKIPQETLLEKMRHAPFEYRKGLTREKAASIAAALNKMGAKTEVMPEGAPSKAPAPRSTGPSAEPPRAPKPTAELSAFDFDQSSPAPPKPAAPKAPPRAAQEFDFAQPTQLKGDGAAPPPVKPPVAEFKFELGAAPQAEPVTPKDESSDGMTIERSSDYTTPEYQETAKKSGGLPPKKNEVVCPRCGTSQPPARECAHCGVIFSKIETAAPEQPAAKPAARKAADKKREQAVRSRWGFLYVLIPLVIVGLAVAAYFLGLTDRFFLDSKIDKDALLKPYSVDIPKPTGPTLSIILNDTEKGTAVVQNIQALRQFLTQKVVESGAAQTVDRFMQIRYDPEVKKAMEAYSDNAFFKILNEGKLLASAYYSFSNANLQVGSTRYGTAAAVTLEEIQKMPENTIPEASSFVDAFNKVFYAVKEREESENRAQTLARVNRNFSDSFSERTLPDRWQFLRETPAAWALRNGALVLRSTDTDFRTRNNAPLIWIEEPTVDYTVELTLLGSVTRPEIFGGILFYQDDNNYFFFALTHRTKPVLLMAAEFNGNYGESNKQAATPRMPLKIEKKNGVYTGYFRDPSRGSWTPLNKLGFSPPWRAGEINKIGLSAWGGDGTDIQFEDFKLELNP
jgi:hypothetical protein